MNRSKIFTIFFLNLFIFCSLFIRFIGLDKMQFINEKIQNKYSVYNKIAQKEMQADVHAIVIQPGKELKITKIFKTPIGKTTNGQIIDSIGNVYNQINNEAESLHLITVEGDTKKWSKYYAELKKSQVLKEIYHIKIHEHTIDVWVHPGVLIQLENINNLEEFFSQFPHLFKKGMLLDLRCTKRIGISRMKI